MENNIKRKVGRPLGSSNKRPNINSKMKIINLNRNVENTPIINDLTGYKWVNWGVDNRFPLYILNLYANSIIHSSCVNFLVNAVIGNGISYESMKINKNELVPNYLETWETFLKKITLDYILFGGFAFQIIKNRDNKTYSFFHQPISTVRLSKKDENGEIKTAWISKDWTNYSMYKPEEIEILNFSDDINVKMSKSYLFVYYDYNIFDEYYSQPYYSSAFDAIEADIQMKKYDLASVKNNFTSSGFILLNRVDEEEERNEILRNIQNSFTGSNNANNLIVMFKNNTDDKPIEYTPFNSHEGSINQFQDNTERTTNRIMSAHRISNKGLIGLPMDSSGFSNQGELLETSYRLTEKLIVNDLRNTIISTINKCLSLNGIETDIILKPLSFLPIQQTNTENEIIDEAIENVDVDVVENKI